MKKYLCLIILAIPGIVPSCNYLEEQSTPHVTALRPPAKNEITTVAVLPFKNTTERKGTEDVLRRCFHANLSATGYEALRLEEVDERLNLASIDASGLDRENAYKIGKIVKADALIYGAVTKCSKRFFGVYSQVVFGAEVRMVDAKSSRVIWQAEHTETTHGGSVPISPFSVPEAIVESSINVREKVVADTADRLAKKFIAGIPGRQFDSSSANIISIRPNGQTMAVYYKVQRGDTLYKISEKFYGDTSRLDEIRSANTVTGDTLTRGQEIIIPGVPILDDVGDSRRVDNNYKKGVYRVKWGDSLYDVASKVFHDGARWTVIYNANRNEIQNIKDLPVGQVIIIPLTISASDSFKK